MQLSIEAVTRDGRTEACSMYISLSASLLIPAELKYCSSCNRHEWKFLFWPSHLGGCIPVVRIDALSLGVTSLSVMRLNASSVLARTSALASAGCVSCVHPVCSLSTSISLARLLLQSYFQHRRSEPLDVRRLLRRLLLRCHSPARRSPSAR